MKRIALLAVLLAGCAQAPVLQPGPVIKVPVAVHCRHEPLIKPDFPIRSLAADASALQLLQACLETDKLRQAFELDCEAVVTACR